MAEWGYAEKNGPSTWASVAPAAAGKRQSPIDIDPAAAVFDQKLKDNPLKVKYIPDNTHTVTNTGHSFLVDVHGPGSCLSGGPVDNKYEVFQFHAHWGKSDATGSEHRVKGKMYAAEMHIVHYNTDLFKAFGEAASEDKGLCVLGMFIKPGKEHAGFKKITDLCSKIPDEGNSIAIEGGFDPACLLPKDTSKYWTYLGSLTTPPCYESVTWIVFQEPIEMSEAQLVLLRHLDDPKFNHEHHTDICGQNFRPPVPLCGRVVSSSCQS